MEKDTHWDLRRSNVWCRARYSVQNKSVSCWPRDMNVSHLLNIFTVNYGFLRIQWLNWFFLIHWNCGHWLYARRCTLLWTLCARWKPPNSEISFFSPCTFYKDSDQKSENETKQITFKFLSNLTWAWRERNINLCIWCYLLPIKQ